MFFRTRGSDLLSFCIFDITITKESGNNIKDILFHSVMIRGEWASIGLLSLPLGLQKQD